MKLRVKIDDQSFEVEVGDTTTRPILAMVDGETFEVWPEENGKAAAAAASAAAVAATTAKVEPAPAAKAAPANGNGGAADKSRAVLAPIPGVILSISVKEGDKVAVAQELCVLEAMKMKNSIRATRSGTIGAILVAVGDQVRHSQVLMDYAD